MAALAGLGPLLGLPASRPRHDGRAAAGRRLDDRGGIAGRLAGSLLAALLPAADAGHCPGGCHHAGRLPCGLASRAGMESGRPEARGDGADLLPCSWFWQLVGTAAIQVRSYLLVPPQELTVRYKGGGQWVALRALGRELARRSSVWPDPHLYIWGWQSPLHFYGRLDGVTRHFFVDNLLRDQAERDHPLIKPRIAEIMRALREKPPALIFVGYQPFPELRAFLLERYLPSRLVPSVNGLGLWVDREHYAAFEALPAGTFFDPGHESAAAAWSSPAMAMRLRRVRSGFRFSIRNRRLRRVRSGFRFSIRNRKVTPLETGGLRRGRLRRVRSVFRFSIRNRRLRRVRSGFRFSIRNRRDAPRRVRSVFRFSIRNRKVTPLETGNRA